MLQRDGASIRLVLPQAGESRTLAYRGSLAPIAGWVSRGLDSREPATTIVWKARLTGRTVLRSAIVV